jgi:hypothetical protein
MFRGKISALSMTNCRRHDNRFLIGWFPCGAPANSSRSRERVARLTAQIRARLDYDDAS